MNVARNLLLALVCGCGPVGVTAPESPVEAIAREAARAALQAAVVEACRLHMPAVDAHPLARLAWVMACGSPHAGEG